MNEKKYEKGLKLLQTPESKQKALENRAETYRKRKLFKETISTLLSKSLKRGELATADDIMSLAEMDGKNVDVQTAILIAVVQRALMGDMTAVQFLRDTVGEKPSDKVEVDQNFTVESWAKRHKVKL
jgi:hypothetical protein